MPADGPQEFAVAFWGSDVPKRHSCAPRRVPRAGRSGGGGERGHGPQRPGSRRVPPVRQLRDGRIGEALQRPCTGGETLGPMCNSQLPPPPLQTASYPQHGTSPNLSPLYAQHQVSHTFPQLFNPNPTGPAPPIPTPRTPPPTNPKRNLGRAEWRQGPERVLRRGPLYRTVQQASQTRGQPRVPSTTATPKRETKYSHRDLTRSHQACLLRYELLLL